MVKNFHEHKLWQEAYVTLMDLHELADKVQARDHNREVVENLLEAGQQVATKIADGLSRADNREARQLIYASVGLVAVVRTQLAVVWGRGLLDDPTFQQLDTKYANLSNALQQYR